MREQGERKTTVTRFSGSRVSTIGTVHIKFWHTENKQYATSNSSSRVYGIYRYLASPIEHYK